MFYRVLFGAVPTLLFFAIVTGAVPVGSHWWSSSHSTTVPHTPDEVADALSDFKLVPGAESPLKGERTADGYVWTIAYHDKPTTNLLVHLEPLDGGKSTRVTSEVQLLPAAKDADVPGIFRETGFAAGMLDAGLDEALNPLEPDDRRLPDLEARKQHVSKITQVEASFAIYPGLAAIESSVAGVSDQREETAQASEDAGVQVVPGQPMMNLSTN